MLPFYRFDLPISSLPNFIKRLITERLLYIICLTFLTNSILIGQDQYKFQTLFIFNFARYIEWPELDESNDFVIGVVGNELTVNQFKKNLIGRPKGKTKINVIDITNSVNYKQCQLIFVASEFTTKLSAIKNSIGSEPILLVTEKEGALKTGSMINLLIRNEKMTFELNEDLLKRSPLKVSTQILRLAQS